MLNNVSWGANKLTVEDLSTRQLQRESSRALASGAIVATSANLTKYNKQAPHNSHLWYRQYGGLPSKTGPGQSVKLILEE